MIVLNTVFLYPMKMLFTIVNISRVFCIMHAITLFKGGFAVNAHVSIVIAVGVQE